MNFTHLHVHTEYSLLDGSAKIAELVAHAKALGMHSLAITDHGVMYGAINFYKEAKTQGIKPIIGCEVYVAAGDCKSREMTKENRNNYHLVLLAENMQGYKNLIKLVSTGFTEGFYYKPRVDISLLRKYNAGIIALSGCLSGVISKPLDKVGYKKAKEMALLYKNIFGTNRFFIELQDYGMSRQRELNPLLVQIAEECDLQLVATNDVHYIHETDANAHDILLCIQTGKTVEDKDRLKFEGNQFYLKSPQQMKELFHYAPQAIENTNIIAARCNVDIEFNQYKLPKYKLPDNTDPFKYLTEICMTGLSKKYDNPDLHTDRLRYELEIIHSMGFVDYFLITWDFIKYAKDNGISVGPGRGSAAGSLVAYSLDITAVDPIKYGLLFERFLNPERISMPDIDIDFCYERRQEVIDYCIEKYGSNHFAQIITFGTMAARAAIRDVGRVLNIPYNKVDTIAKLVPRELDISLDRAMKISVELKKAYDTQEETKYLIDMAKRVEGLPRHASTHAAGVVITDKEVSEYVPLNQNDGVITTGYAMGNLEELGLLKIDFLGLRTLTIIDSTVKEIERTQGVKIDIHNLDLNDPAVYKLISSGNTDGVFQLESSGMKSFLKELRPDSIEDLIAGVALYRPGPMDFIPKYVAGKHGGSIQYTHPSLEPILKNTYGCIVYQEQVMEIVRQLAGYSLSRSDMLRRAMSKKRADVMDAEYKNFVYGIEGDVAGCVANGIPADIAGKIFNEMEDFAKYAFNKSHAAAYAVIGFQTAYLKTYYPKEFMAAFMSTFISNNSSYIDSCKKMGIAVSPPNINKGLGNFSVEGENILFGLNAIKNVGRPLVRSIVAERANGSYKSLTDFIKRIHDKDLNKRSLESLIKAGAFDVLGGNRRQYMAVFSDILENSSRTKREALPGQIGLFELIHEDLTKDNLPNLPDYDLAEKLAMEKEVLGTYVSGHPLSRLKKLLATKVTATTEDLLDIKDGAKVAIGGMIIAKSVHVTKNNETMAFLTIEDTYGTIEVVVFPGIYKKHYHLLGNGKTVLIGGRINTKEGEDPKIIANTVEELTEKAELWIKLPKNTALEIEEIVNICSGHSGATPVIIYKEATKTKYNFSSQVTINTSGNLIPTLKELLGEDSVVLKLLK
ncbi:MAG: DNA polymerase III subunit alpha [Defluviitaleaceae bacterium]|nr:DNA polymerase III subunit alpha [Defluviitaleaceae bacterium]